MTNLRDQLENEKRLRGILEEDKINSLSKMKVPQQCFPVALFLTLYKVVLTFEPTKEIFKFAHSNKSYWAVLSCGTVSNAVQGGSNF